MCDRKQNEIIQQWHVKLRCSTQNVLRLILGMLMVLLTLSACEQQPSKPEIENAKTELTAVLNTFYVPKDAVQLAENVWYGYSPILTNCIVKVTADSAYQSPHSFKDVLDDYRQSLTKAGWESSPYYRHDQSDVDFFDLEPKTSLTISSASLSSDVSLADMPTVTSTQTFVIYYLQITISSPSISDCRSG